MIFHTDNGKGFTAKVVLEFFQDLNPNILAVTVRPRHPSEQGSVELCQNLGDKGQALEFFGGTGFHFGAR